MRPHPTGRPRGRRVGCCDAGREPSIRARVLVERACLRCLVEQTPSRSRRPRCPRTRATCAQTVVRARRRWFDCDMWRTAWPDPLRTRTNGAVGMEQGIGTQTRAHRRAACARPRPEKCRSVSEQFADIGRQIAYAPWHSIANEAWTQACDDTCTSIVSKRTTALKLFAGQVHMSKG